MTMTDVQRYGDLVSAFVKKAVNAPYIEFILGMAFVMVYVVSIALKQMTVERLVELGGLWPLAVVACFAVGGNALVSCVSTYCQWKYPKRYGADHA